MSFASFTTWLDKLFGIAPPTPAQAARASLANAPPVQIQMVASNTGELTPKQSGPMQPPPSPPPAPVVTVVPTPIARIVAANDSLQEMVLRQAIVDAQLTPGGIVAGHSTLVGKVGEGPVQDHAPLTSQLANVGAKPIPVDPSSYNATGFTNQIGRSIDVPQRASAGVQPSPANDPLLGNIHLLGNTGIRPPTVAIPSPSKTVLSTAPQGNTSKPVTSPAPPIPQTRSVAIPPVVVKQPITRSLASKLGG